MEDKQGTSRSLRQTDEGESDVTIAKRKITGTTLELYQQRTSIDGYLTHSSLIALRDHRQTLLTTYMLSGLMDALDDDIASVPLRE